MSDPDPAHLRAEIRQQLVRFRELTGRRPTHLDTHHHAHRLPAVLQAVIAVAREHGLPVRNASLEVGGRLREAAIATTDFFIERFFGEEARLEVLLEILASLQPGTTELMCHPARVDEELRTTSSYTDERERELAALIDPEALRFVGRRGIRLATFAACRTG